MRYAVISDVHGNLHALKAVLADADEQGIDEYLFIGDYIFDMPFSNEVVRCIMQIKNKVVVTGNKEEFLPVLDKSNQNEWTQEQRLSRYETYRELLPDVREYLDSLPETVCHPLESGGSIYVNHYFKKSFPDAHEISSTAFYEKMKKAPYTHDEYLKWLGEYINRPQNKELLRSADAKIVLHGHNHLQGWGRFGDRLFVNPGSCGQPLDFDSRAAYTIIDDAGDISVTERRIKYDIEAAVTAARKTKICECSQLWSDMVFRIIRDGRDYFGELNSIASVIKAEKGETGYFYTNETYREAYRLFCNTNK